MITIHFKNVGQGDSIIIEWTEKGEKYIGLIDCNKYQGRNPTLDFLISEKIKRIQFIILSHFHLDHFSGMSDIFDHCTNNNIRVKYFYHSLAPFLGEIYNRIFKTQKLQKEIERFILHYESFDAFVEDKIPVNSQTKKFKLLDNISMSFLGPRGRIYDIMAKQLSRKVNKITTSPADINKLSTIVIIENEKNCILLTADSVKSSFKKLDIIYEVQLVQVPHHGSFKSIETEFWKKLKKIPKCPAVFCVGDEPKDKLPNVETVKFFDQENYDIYSTNKVYGINTHFTLPKVVQSYKSMALNSFSKLRQHSAVTASSKYNGDQVFNVF